MLNQLSVISYLAILLVTMHPIIVMFNRTADETTDNVIVLDSEESPSLEQDNHAIVQSYSTKDSAEEEGTMVDEEDHNDHSSSPDSSIELEHGNITDAMLMSTASDQLEINAESESSAVTIVTD